MKTVLVTAARVPAISNGTHGSRTIRSERRGHPHANGKRHVPVSGAIVTRRGERLTTTGDSRPIVIATRASDQAPTRSQSESCLTMWRVAGHGKVSAQPYERVRERE